MRHMCAHKKNMLKLEGANMGPSWVCDKDFEALASNGFTAGSRYVGCLLHDEAGEGEIVSPQWGLLWRSAEVVCPADFSCSGG